MAVYELKLTFDLPDDKDPSGLELLFRQGAMALVPQAGGQIVEDASVTELITPKKGKATK